MRNMVVSKTRATISGTNIKKYKFRHILDIMPEWNDMRSLDMPQEWKDIRRSSDMKELSEIRLGGDTINFNRF